MNIEKLINLADTLDQRGLHEEANRLDNYIEKLAVGPMEYTVPGDKKQQETRVLKDPLMENDNKVDPLPGVFEEEDTKVDIKYDPSEEETMTMEPFSPGLDISTENLKLAFDAFIESPRRFENVKALKDMIDQYVENSVGKTAKMNEVFSGLTSVADDLDNSGLAKAANMIDNFISKYADDVVDWKEEGDTPQSKRYDSEYHKDLQVKQPKPSDMKQDLEKREQQYSGYDEVSTVALSTRNCPNHVGAQLGRIGENTYQCSLDGEVFNWYEGWTDHEGNQHPGSSVAAQTPDATPYGVGHRIFDSRQHIINRIN